VNKNVFLRVMLIKQSHHIG